MVLKNYFNSLIPSIVSSNLEFGKIVPLLVQAKKTILSNENCKEKNVQTHLIFGLTIDDYADQKILLVSHLIGLPSNCYYTLLQANREDLRGRPRLKRDKYDFTIGDDIELFAEELCQANTLVTISESSTIFQRLDDSFEKIHCKRKFQTSDTICNRLKKPWYLHIFFILNCLWVIQTQPENKSWVITMIFYEYLLEYIMRLICIYFPSFLLDFFLSFYLGYIFLGK